MTISPVACLRSLRHFSGISARIRIPSIGELPDGSPPVRRIVSSTNMIGYLLLIPGSAVGGRGVPWGTDGRDLRLGVPRVARGGRRGMAADNGGTRDGTGGNCCRKCCSDIETAWGEDWDLHFLVHFLGLFICSRTTNSALSTARRPGRSKAASCLPLAASCQTAAGRPAGTGQAGDNRRWRGWAAAVCRPGQGTRQPPARRRPDRPEAVRGRPEGVRVPGKARRRRGRPGDATKDADGGRKTLLRVADGTGARRAERSEAARGVRRRGAGCTEAVRGARRRGAGCATARRGVLGGGAGARCGGPETAREVRRSVGPKERGAAGGLSGGGRRDPGAVGHRPPCRFSCRRGQPAALLVERRKANGPEPRPSHDARRQAHTHRSQPRAPGGTVGGRAVPRRSASRDARRSSRKGRRARGSGVRLRRRHGTTALVRPAWSGRTTPAAVYRGTFPCLRCGGCLRLSRSIASPRATADRVCTGSITSSTRPRSAA